MEIFEFAKIMFSMPLLWWLTMGILAAAMFQLVMLDKDINKNIFWLIKFLLIATGPIAFIIFFYIFLFFIGVIVPSAICWLAIKGKDN